jgi:Kef-type K+ transport system membrane component KefB
MRWVASLLALGLMMAVVHHFTALGPVEARATLALGFLLIAAWLGGQLAPRVRLPRVIAFLLVGFCMGPPWLGLIRADELAALRLIYDAGLALIALAAGNALDFKTLGIGRAGFTRLTVGAIAFPFAAVALVVMSVSPWFPLTRHLSLGSAMAVALVLATFAGIASPTVTMAIIDELDTRGPFARAVLGVASAQAALATVVLSFVLVVVLPLASPGAVNVRVVGEALARLCGALAAGGLLGVLVTRYQPAARREGVLLLAVTGFLAATAARVVHIDPVLVGLAAGFYLANAAPGASAEVTRALRQQALPTYLVCFALAGAGLQVDALADLWPWVVLLVGLRATFLRYGVQWAGRSPEATPALAREGWLGLISQAGFALGLAPIVRRALPASGVSLEALIVAVVAVHEVVGPICFRRALVRAGELKEGGLLGEGTGTDEGLGGAAGSGLRGRSDGTPAGDLPPVGGDAAGVAGGAVHVDQPGPLTGVRGLPRERRD